MRKYPIPKINLRAWALAVSTSLAAMPTQAAETPEEAWTCWMQVPSNLSFFVKPIRLWQVGDQGFKMDEEGEIAQMPFRTEAGGSTWVWTLPSSTSEDELVIAINSSNGKGAALSESTNYALPAIDYNCRWEPWDG